MSTCWRSKESYGGSLLLEKNRVSIGGFEKSEDLLFWRIDDSLLRNYFFQNSLDSIIEIKSRTKYPFDRGYKNKYLTYDHFIGYSLFPFRYPLW